MRKRKKNNVLRGTVLGFKLNPKTVLTPKKYYFLHLIFKGGIKLIRLVPDRKNYRILKTTP